MLKLSNPIDRLIGARVRLNRIRMGLSQSEFADALGISLQQAQNYENGADRISAIQLQAIAKFQQVAPSSFFSDLIQVMAKDGDETPAADSSSD
jgi:transcriptional regulator with XRE-family HTH domain